MAKGGFGGFGGGNMQQLMRQAQKMQENMLKAQEEIAVMETTGTAGGGMVTAVVTGTSTLKSIEIKPDVVDPDDIDMLQDLVVAAVNEAYKSVESRNAAEMEKIQPEINRAIEEAMKAIDINEKAAKEASKEKSSFSGIVYIDGMESSKERMDNLNPDRIASMNVYKGNEAIAKFGEKGRNGVIEIKLKK